MLIEPWLGVVYVCLLGPGVVCAVPSASRPRENTDRKGGRSRGGGPVHVKPIFDYEYGTEENNKRKHIRVNFNSDMRIRRTIYLAPKALDAK